MRPPSPRPLYSRGGPRSPAPRRRPRLLAHREQRQVHLETIGRSNPAPFSGSRLVVWAGAGSATPRTGVGGKWPRRVEKLARRAPASRRRPPRDRRAPRRRPGICVGLPVPARLRAPGPSLRATSISRSAPGRRFIRSGSERGSAPARAFRRVGPAEGAGGRGGATGVWSGARRGERRTRPESRAIMNAQQLTPLMFDIVAEWLRRQT